LAKHSSLNNPNLALTSSASHSSLNKLNPVLISSASHSSRNRLSPVWVNTVNRNSLNSQPWVNSVVRRCNSLNNRFPRQGLQWVEGTFALTAMHPSSPGGSFAPTARTRYSSDAVF